MEFSIFVPTPYPLNIETSGPLFAWSALFPRELVWSHAILQRKGTKKVKWIGHYARRYKTAIVINTVFIAQKFTRQLSRHHWLDVSFAGHPRRCPSYWGSLDRLCAVARCPPARPIVNILITFDGQRSTLLCACVMRLQPLPGLQITDRNAEANFGCGHTAPYTYASAGSLVFYNFQ